MKITIMLRTTAGQPQNIVIYKTTQCWNKKNANHTKENSLYKKLTCAILNLRRTHEIGS